MFGVALIGIGYWGSTLRRYVIQNPNFELKYVCNSSSDLGEVWNDSSVTAVVIATPNHTHYELIKAALLSGKHVFSEKPLTLRFEECMELGEVARERDLRIVVDYTYAFSRALSRAEVTIGSGKIGKVLGMELAVRHLGRFGGGSCYWLLGSHMLSVLNMFTPIRDLHFRMQDVVVVDGQVETGAICFTGGVSGQIVVSLNYVGKETRVVVYGEHGTLIYNPLTDPVLTWEVYERTPWTVAAELQRQQTSFSIDEANNLGLAIEYFSRVLKGRSRSNLACAIEITRILESLDRNGACTPAVSGEYI